MTNIAESARCELTQVDGERIVFEHVPAANNPDSIHILFCGGFHSSMMGNKATSIAAYARAQGWAFTRFDYRGHGASTGEPRNFTLHDWLDDTIAVLDAHPSPTVLVGSSMGAWLATLAAIKRPDQIKGLLLLAAAPDFLQELVQPRLGPSDIWDLQQGQAVELSNNYAEPFPITQDLLDSGSQLAILSNDSLLSLSCPLRLIHGSHDTDVPYSLSIRLMNAINHTDARLSLLNKADHRLSDQRSLQHINEQLSQLIETL